MTKTVGKLPIKLAVIQFNEGKNRDYEMNIFAGTRITIKGKIKTYFNGTIEQLLWKLNERN